MGASASQQNKSFKDANSFDERKKVADKILRQNPNKIPVICEQFPNSHLPYYPIIKYQINDNMTVEDFMSLMRKKLQLEPERGIFIFINNTLPQTSTSIKELYDIHKDKDGFLYMRINGDWTS